MADLIKSAKILKPMKPRMSVYALLLLAVVCLMWMLRECSAPHPLSQGERRPSGGDTIDVAIEYSPLALYTYQDTLGGFGYDMLRLMAAAEGIPVKFHPLVTLREAMEGLHEGYYDVIVADAPMTSEYQEYFTYTEPVYLDRQVLVQRRDSVGSLPVASQLDLASKEVWVTANSPIIGRIRNLSAEIGDSIIVRQDQEYGAEQLFILTATGEIPRAVINERTARKLAADYDDMDVDISTSVSFTQFQSWVVGKDNKALCDTLNEMIVRFKNSDEYRILAEKYLE